MRILRLISAIVLLLFAVGNLVIHLMHGTPLDAKSICFITSFLILGVGRLIAFAMPNNPAINIFRIVGLLIFMGYVFLKH